MLNIVTKTQLFTKKNYFKKFSIDAIVILTIFFSSGIIGSSFLASGKVPITKNDYQVEYAPAVEFACGDRAVGKNNLDLTEFLALKTQSISCEVVPPRSEPQNMFQKIHQYLMYSVGITWKITGIEWGNLKYLYGFLYAIASCFAYGIFRLGAGKLLSILATGILVTSFFQLENLTHLRDYSKAPFIFAQIYFCGLLASLKLRKKLLFIISIFSGAFLGIGIGFRVDLLIFLPVFIITVLFFLPKGGPHTLGDKLISLGYYFGAFIILGWPILHVIGGGSNNFHAIALGLVSYYDVPLKILPSIYEFGYRYNDTYVWEIINTYASNNLDSKSTLDLATKGYDKAGFYYYIEILKNYPADLIIRFYSAVIIILELLAYKGDLSLINIQKFLLMFNIPIISIIFLLIISYIDLKKSIFVFFIILILCGYPSLQFQERHFFHLQLVSIWILTATISGFFIITYRLIFQTNYINLSIYKIRHKSIKHIIRKILIASLIFFIIPISMLMLLRAYQVNNIKNIFESYKSFTLKSNSLTKTISEDIIYYKISPDSENSDIKKIINARYWVAEFDGGKCDVDIINMGINYTTADHKNKYLNEYYNHSRIVNIPIFENAKYYFVTFDANNGPDIHRFSSISLSKNSSNCFIGLSEVSNRSEFPTLLNNVLLDENWKEKILFQRLDFEKKFSNNLSDRFYSDDSVTPIKAKKLIEATPTIVIQNQVYASKLAIWNDGGVFFRGKPESRFAYLMQLKKKEIGETNILLISGELINGSISIGYATDDKWAKQVNIDQVGNFFVAFGLKRTNAVPIIAANLKPGQTDLNVRIHKFGWAKETSANTRNITKVSIPDLSSWGATSTVHIVSIQDGIEIRGDSTQFGYQIVSPAIDIAKNSTYFLSSHYVLHDGKACLGILDQKNNWLISPSNDTKNIEFASKDNNSIRLVFANCNVSTNSPPSRFVIRSLNLFKEQ